MPFFLKYNFDIYLFSHKNIWEVNDFRFHRKIIRLLWPIKLLPQLQTCFNIFCWRDSSINYSISFNIWKKKKKILSTYNSNLCYFEAIKLNLRRNRSSNLFWKEMVCQTFISCCWKWFFFLLWNICLKIKTLELSSIKW